MRNEHWKASLKLNFNFNFWVDWFLVIITYICFHFLLRFNSIKEFLRKDQGIKDLICLRYAYYFFFPGIISRHGKSHESRLNLQKIKWVANRNGHDHGTYVPLCVLDICRAICNLFGDNGDWRCRFRHQIHDN